MAHYHTERNHQDFENRFQRADPTVAPSDMIERYLALNGFVDATVRKSAASYR
jgi:hypothetical protein